MYHADDIQQAEVHCHSIVISKKDNSYIVFP